MDMNTIVGTHDLLLLVFDTLRYDVAVSLLAAGRTPNLKALLPASGWEERHAPGNFTYASHQAFFAGFLPTPARPGRHPRLFALPFQGSETTAETTCILNGTNIVEGLAAGGYHTICIGGVGFFNKQSLLGSVLPGLFQESHWSTELGVTNPRSTALQFELAAELLRRRSQDERVFLFINLSALHQPNRHYLQGATEDSLESHAAALEYVDSQLPSLFQALRQRGPTFCILCSDHGTAYGEDGYHGHRLSHPVVWTVPYAEFVLARKER